MPQFSYKARRPSGELVEGTLEVPDRSTAVGQIDRMGLFPVSVKTGGKGARAKKAAARSVFSAQPAAQADGAAAAQDDPARARAARVLTLGSLVVIAGGLLLSSLSGVLALIVILVGMVLLVMGLAKRRPPKPKQQDLAGFSRQLANLLNAGMTVTTALGSMTSLEIRGIPPGLISRLRQDVMEGKSLSAAMAGYPDIFTDMYINLVRAGEQSGSLVEVLRRLAHHYERFAELRHKVTTALVYPAFVLVVSVAMVFFFMLFMMPKFQEIFDDMTGPGGQVELPWLTQVLMDVSGTMKRLLEDPLSEPLVLAVVGIGFLLGVLVMGLAWRGLKSPGGRRRFDGWLLRLWLVKRIVRPSLFAQFARTLGTLMQNGVPVLTALQITERVLPNTVLKDALAKTREGVTDGKTLAQPLARSGVFPQLMVDMIHVGEQTGDVPAALNNVAETYESELTVSLRVITALVEPILIVFIALFVGTLLVAVLSAMFKISSSLGGVR